MSSRNCERDNAQLSLCNEITSAIRNRELKSVDDVLKYVENRASILRNEIISASHRDTSKKQDVIHKTKITLR